MEFDGFRVVEEAATNIIALGQAHGIAETVEISLVHRFDC
jgi:hypothetical protein